MPIQVTCPGCRTRFSVSEKFAGRSGACPKCKGQITVPAKGEEVVIHGAEEFGGVKDATGKLVLKPIGRTDMKVQPIFLFGAGAAAFVVLLTAVMLRFGVQDKEQFPLSLLALGAIVLAPPVVLGGYTALRHDELEPYQGVPLMIRVGICSVVYALLWGVCGLLNAHVFNGPPEFLQLAFLLPALAVVGATAAFATLDLEFGSAGLHYGGYLLVTVVLRLIVGLPPF